jgi:hypothetical protein
MDVRTNKIAQAVAQFSTEDLNAAYKDIVQFRNTGVCPEGKLRELELVVRNVMEQKGEVFRHTEDYILMEMARRFYNMTSPEEYSSLKHGDPIFYLDDKTGDIEPGLVFTIRFKEEKIDSISVNFENDFDEFAGTALGKCLFRTREAARMFWQKGSK